MKPNFVSDIPTGKCRNPNNEYGSSQPTTLVCAFHKNGECYFSYDCDKKSKEDNPNDSKDEVVE